MDSRIFRLLPSLSVIHLTAAGMSGGCNSGDPPSVARLPEQPNAWRFAPRQHPARACELIVPGGAARRCIVIYAPPTQHGSLATVQADCNARRLPLAANAETSVVQSRVAYKAACKVDVKTFCAGAEKKGACLKVHVKEISSECRDARKAYRVAKKQGEPK